MTQHLGTVEGPLSYPGGKDGSYVGTCSCGQYSTGPVGFPGHAEARLAEHKRAKEAAAR